ncbi:hypothetical protein BDQ12DRAFT_667705 [Crucibulum laeve]|uniref:Uncharacterized protein n=1 Tax=Crucibulum laeve TaxID=68775 RepID=A0A5C3LW14_9AGAR|nr:hypothetical protein BDQ12DRAFT_667705 [Crucibulum laeve]
MPATCSYQTINPTQTPLCPFRASYLTERRAPFLKLRQVRTAIEPTRYITLSTASSPRLNRHTVSTRPHIRHLTLNATTNTSLNKREMKYDDHEKQGGSSSRLNLRATSTAIESRSRQGWGADLLSSDATVVVVHALSLLSSKAGIQLRMVSSGSGLGRPLESDEE